MPLPKGVDEVRLGGASAAHVRRTEQRASLRAVEAIAPGVPQLPESLDFDETAIWTETVELLRGRNSLTPVDSHILEIFCRTKNRWKKESIMLLNEGTIVQVTKVIRNQPIVCDAVNPRCDVVARLEKSLFTLMSNLGITPRSRRSVKPAEPPKEDLIPGTVAWEEKYGS
ncbi:MAG TPA: P27 family phage terminase small subunit [Candidatus Acidoferrales bacterium]|nr:P27 family phage terminase small subunit [Candidatus Acidoferrales bacterium]